MARPEDATLMIWESSLVICSVDEILAHTEVTKDRSAYCFIIAAQRDWSPNYRAIIAQRVAWGEFRVLFALRIPAQLDFTTGGTH